MEAKRGELAAGLLEIVEEVEATLGQATEAWPATEA